MLCLPAFRVTVVKFLEGLVAATRAIHEAFQTIDVGLVATAEEMPVQVLVATSRVH